MISVKKAHQIINGFIPHPSSETVPLESCSGRILAQEICAPFPQPRFDNTAMDGYAVRSKDTSGASKTNPVKLTLVNTIRAGSTESSEINSGECARIMTGAPIPEGSDAVVMVEHTSGFNEVHQVSIFSSVRIRENIRFAGEEIRENESLIKKGNEISSGEIGVLATFGFEQVKVFKNANISVFATGDELKSPGEKLKPGEIYNSNLPVLADLIQKSGSKLIHSGTVGDNPKSLIGFLKKTFPISDIIIASGGISMGKFDYVRDVFSEMGVKEHFWKVAQKPGKPLFFGTSKDKMIFGLPGNPVSSYICFTEYIWPVLQKWKSAKKKEKVGATLKSPFPTDQQKHRFLFGIVWSEKGKLYCEPTEKLGSHMQSSALNANAILEAKPDQENLPAGQIITVNILPGSALS